MYSIAIDGPSGVGKSSISKEISRQLGFIYVDTGALYRCVGLYAYENNIDSTDKQRVIDVLPKIKIEMRHVNGIQKVFLNGEDVSEKIRLSKVAIPTSNSASVPEVREFLKNLQQDIAKTNNIIMDGRDIGTVILPNATVKLFLTASPQERAMRRYKQEIENGEKIEYNDVLADIIKRDDNDTNRKTAPLKAAEDAIIVDTTNYNLQETIDMITSIIRSKL